MGEVVATSKIVTKDKQSGLKFIQPRVMSSIINKAMSGQQSNIIDGFEQSYGKNELLRPMFDPATLCTFSFNSDTISQCVEALTVNVDFTGYAIKFQAPLANPDQNPSAADMADRKRVELLFRQPNPHQSLRKFRAELRVDKSYTGYRCTEVVRNIIGDPVELYRVPAKSVRMSKPDTTDIEVNYAVRMDDGSWEEKTSVTRFRKYCQQIGNKKVWFKSFGDPRSLNKLTGEFAKGDGRFPLALEATELVFDSYPSNNSPYGEAPWVSEIINIVGAKLAKDVNYLYFDNKGIPQFAILVSGGYLPSGESGEDVVEQISGFIETNIAGVQNFHKSMILQAMPYKYEDAAGGEKASPVKIEFVPLAQFMQQDALFQNYIKNNADAVLKKFRIAPALVGASTDYSHAAVKEAKIISEQQAFAPLRHADDEMFNQILLSMGIRNWRFESLPLPIVDNVDILDAMSKTPDLIPVGHAVDFLCALMGKEPPQMDEKVRNMLYGEYRQQFTPAFDLFGGSGDPFGRSLIQGLSGLRKAIEKKHQVQ
ncbi:MAG: hypothetical protein WBP42_02545 [Candidatus Zixiibacteriota bacterium]